MRGHPMSRPTLLATLRSSWAQPGTRLGFWVHFTTPFSAHLLVMLWGFPFLVLSEGLSETVAGALLSLIIVAVVASGPVLGWVVGNHPWHRSTVALGTIAAMAATWTAVLAWPGEAPLWLLVLLIVACGCGGPASMIGFDVGRTSNPPDRMASATRHHQRRRVPRRRAGVFARRRGARPDDHRARRPTTPRARSGPR